MKRTPVFRFLPLQWWDVALYLVFLLVFLYACGQIDFENRFVSTGARETLVWTSLIGQFAVLHFLHRWIKNAANFCFLLLIGVAWLALYVVIAGFRFETLHVLNVFMLVAWLPFVIVLQLFRIVKLNQTKGIELAIPLKRSSSFTNEPATGIDFVCLLTCYFVIAGTWCIVNA